MKKSLLLNLSLVGLKEKDYTSCISYAEAVLALEPNNIKALFRKGCSLMEIGELQRAKEEL